MKIVLFVIATFFLTLHVDAQHKVNLSAGIGYPSLLHGELGYQYKKLELSFRHGRLDHRSKGYRFNEINLRFHFMKHGNMYVAKQRYWTTSIGLGEYWARKYVYKGHLSVFYNVIGFSRAGYHVELGKRFNVAATFGPSFRLPIDTAIDQEGRFPLIGLSGAIKLQWEIIQTEGW